MSDGELLWNVIERIDGHDYRVFRTRRHRARHGEREREFSVIEAPDWVNVIPLTPRDDVVMVRQFRHGIEALTLEIPGGTVDPGESAADAAARELREETGYAARRLVRLGEVEPNPAIQTNRCSTWLALDVERVGEIEPDGGEVLSVEVHALAEVAAMLRDGRIGHALVIAAFGHLMLAAGGRLSRPRP